MQGVKSLNCATNLTNPVNHPAELILPGCDTSSHPDKSVRFILNFTAGFLIYTGHKYGFFPMCSKSLFPLYHIPPEVP